MMKFIQKVKKIMTKIKRYYWLKLFDNDFTDVNMLQLRKLPGGSDLTIIYLKMMLIAIKNECYIIQEDPSIPLHEELALIMNESPESVLMLLSFLKNKNLFTENETGKFYMPNVEKRIGSETDVAQRVRKFREKQKQLQGKNTELLQCNNDVTTCNKNVTIEKIREEKNLYSSNNNKEIINNTMINTPTGDLNKNIAAAFTEFCINEYLWPSLLQQYGEKRILECIEEVRNRKNVQRPGGMLLRMLKEHWPISKDLEKTLEKQEQQKKKNECKLFCQSCPKSFANDSNWLCQKDGYRWDYDQQKFVDCEYCKK